MHHTCSDKSMISIISHHTGPHLLRSGKGWVISLDWLLIFLWIECGKRFNLVVLAMEIGSYAAVNLDSASVA